MRTGMGTVAETYLEGMAAARVSCPLGLVPAPGQYLLAVESSAEPSPHPYPIFPAGRATDGFRAAAPFPEKWIPGTSLNLRRPLGNGFKLPSSSRAVALAAFGETIQRLAALIEPALAQGASVTLLCDARLSGLPNEVEIMPLASLAEAAHWADFIVLDMPRAMASSLPDLAKKAGIPSSAQVLLSTPMPCGGRGDCGVCAVHVKRGYKLVCKDGPVLELKTFL